jgi:hypothetical protein
MGAKGSVRKWTERERESLLGMILNNGGVQGVTQEQRYAEVKKEEYGEVLHGTVG